MLAELSNQSEKAHQYVDRALALDERHTVAHLAKGFFYRSAAHTTEQAHRNGLVLNAVRCYKRAKDIEKGNMNAYQGLVECYTTLKQNKPALAVGMPSDRATNVLLCLLMFPYAGCCVVVCCYVQPKRRLA